MNQGKPWYLSKTILTNILMAVAVIVAQFNAPAADFIKTNFAEIGVGWGIVNVILRIITKQEIS